MDKDVKKCPPMSSEFEKLLVERGFTVEELECECDHEKPLYYIMFFQQCPCCLDDEIDEDNENSDDEPTIRSDKLAWYKQVVGCEECTESELGCLDCGGHYSNFRLFRIEGDRDEIDNDHYFSQHEPDPEGLVYVA